MTQQTSIDELLSQASYAAAAGNYLALSGCLSQISTHHEFTTGQADQAVVSWLDRHVRAAWDGGWQPADLIQFAERKVDSVQQRLLRDSISAENRRYSVSETDSRWADQLRAAGATEMWWRDSHGSLAAWAEGYGMPSMAILHALAELVGFMFALPRLPILIPPPGDPHVASSTAYAGPNTANSKVLSRVRALLAKAESSEFPDEAEALSAKAQEMMTKYALDRALVDAGPVPSSGSQPGPAVRRIWVDAPYVSAKTYLVAIVGNANACKSVTYDALGFITVLGEQVDVELVELLATSLLVQAGRAMLSARANVPSRSRSFRRAFLISYANRIGERLEEAKQHTERAVSEADRSRLLPVLARRDAAIDSKFAELFPTVRSRRTTVSNHAGWAAGRAAADQASLSARAPVPPR